MPCPSDNWICPNSPPRSWHSRAHMRRRPWGGTFPRLHAWHACSTTPLMTFGLNRCAAIRRFVDRTEDRPIGDFRWSVAGRRFPVIDRMARHRHLMHDSESLRLDNSKEHARGDDHLGLFLGRAADMTVPGRVSKNADGTGK